MYVRQGQGEYAAGEWHSELLPRLRRAGDPLVIWAHEHGASGKTWPAAGLGQGALAVVDGAGLVGASADLGGDAWGSPTAVQRVVALFNFMRAKYPWVRQDKFLMFGGSMGGLTALNVLHNHPELVVACLAVIPAVSLDYHRNQDPNNFTAEVDAAYGQNPVGGVLEDDYSPHHHMTRPPGVPLKIITSSDDAQAPHELADAYATAVGAEWESMGPVGHTFGGTVGAPGSYNRMNFARWLRAQVA